MKDTFEGFVSRKQFEVWLKNMNGKIPVRKALFRFTVNGKPKVQKRFFCHTFFDNQRSDLVILAIHKKVPSVFSNPFNPRKVDWSDVEFVAKKRELVSFCDVENPNGDYDLDGDVVIYEDILGTHQYNENDELNSMKLQFENLQKENILLKSQKASSEVAIQDHSDYNDFIQKEADNRLMKLDGLRKALFVGGGNEGGKPKQ